MANTRPDQISIDRVMERLVNMRTSDGVVVYSEEAPPPRCIHEILEGEDYLCRNINPTDEQRECYESFEYRVCDHCHPSFPCFQAVRGDPEQYKDQMWTDNIYPWQSCRCCRMITCDDKEYDRSNGMCGKCLEGAAVARELEKIMNITHIAFNKGERGIPYENMKWKKYPLTTISTMVCFETKKWVQMTTSETEINPDHHYSFRNESYELIL